MRWVAVFLLAGCGSSNVPFEAGDLTVNAPRAPSAVIAFRDGDHAWVVASGAESPLVFRVSTGEYTVAIGCSDTSVGRVAHADVYEMTLADLASLTYDRDCDMSSAQVALTGNVAGIDPNSDGGYQVAWGDVFQNTNGQQYGFTTHVGTRDLVATRGSVATDRLLIIRDFVVASNTVQSVDFGSPDAISLVPQPIANPAGYLLSYFFSAGGTAVELGAFQAHVDSVPLSAMGPGDLQRVDVAARSGIGYGQIFTTQRISRAPTTTIELVQPIQEHPLVTAALRNGVVDLHATWGPQANAVLYELYAGKWSVHASPEVLETTGMSVPDLSAVRGWDPSLALTASATDWAMSVATGVLLDDALRTLPIHEGEIRRSGWTGFVSP